MIQGSNKSLRGAEGRSVQHERSIAKLDGAAWKTLKRETGGEKARRETEAKGSREKGVRERESANSERERTLLVTACRQQINQTQIWKFKSIFSINKNKITVFNGTEDRLYTAGYHRACWYAKVLSYVAAWSWRRLR